MLMVGASKQTALRAFVSAASRRPASSVRSLEKVAPIQVALGRAEAGAKPRVSYRSMVRADCPQEALLTHVVE